MNFQPDEEPEESAIVHRKPSRLVQAARSLGFVLIFAAIVVVVIWFAARGSVSEAFRLSPNLDPSTPAKQGNFELLGLARKGYDQQFDFKLLSGEGDYDFAERDIWQQFALLVHATKIPPDIPVPKNAPPWKMQFVNQPAEKFTAWATDPEGHTTTIGCAAAAPSDKSGAWEIPGNNLVVEYPAAVPERWHYLDITLKDRLGNSAKWRVTDLPHVHKVLPDSPIINDDQTVDRMHMHLVGLRYTNKDGTSSAEAKCTCTKEEHSPFQYEVEETGCTTDYAAYPDFAQWPFQTYFGGGAECRTWGIYASNAIVGFGGWPDASHQNFIQLSGLVRKYAMLEEPVTFHDVDIVTTKYPNGGFSNAIHLPRDEFAKTRSGILVSFINPPPSEEIDDMETPRLQLRPAFNMDPVYDFSSVLCRQYLRPVQFEYDVQRPYTVGSWYTDENQSSNPSEFIDIYSPNKKIENLHFDNFTVIVRQRVLLKETPFTMTTRLVNTVRRKGA